MAKSKNQPTADTNASKGNTDTAQNSTPVTGTSATSNAVAASRSVTPATGLKGTVQELVAGGVKLNGTLIDANTVTHLRKFHMNEAMKVAGYAPKAPGTKGKSAEIVELLDAPGFKFEAGAATAAA